MTAKQKHYTLRFNLEHRSTFNAVRTGKKKVETRAATVRYHGIRAGDRITFVCGADRFSRTVKKSTHFKTTAAIFKVYRVPDINPKFTTRAQMLAQWHSFPSYREKIAKYGLMAIEV